jgi:hypothetical protein
MAHDVRSRREARCQPSSVRKLIKAAVLKSEQIMPDAPHQIRAVDLESEPVIAALKRKGRPCRADSENQISMFSDT